MDGITASSSILLLICRETYAVLCLETFLPGGLHVANAHSDGSAVKFSNRSRALRLRESFASIRFSLST